MNKVILMGRLTRDPEVRYTQTNNTLVASFSIAVNRRFTRPGEERQADFINVVAWSKLGEFCSKYFKKGQQVGVIGRIQTRTWLPLLRMSLHLESQGCSCPSVQEGYPCKHRL